MSRPIVSIIGFGAFGQLIARHLRDHAHLTICDPQRRSNNLPSVSPAEAAQAEIVILAVPLSQMEVVLRNIAPYLRRGTVVIDVASFKEEPARLMQQILPEHVQLSPRIPCSVRKVPSMASRGGALPGVPCEARLIDRSGRCCGGGTAACRDHA